MERPKVCKNYQTVDFVQERLQADDCGTVRILIVLRDKVFRDALAAVLPKFAALEVVHCSGVFDACAIHQDVEQHSADIVILHEDSNGDATSACVKTLKRLRHESQIIVIGLADNDSQILAAIEAGASGFATNAMSMAELVDNIYAVAQGKTLCSPHITSLLFSHIANNSDRNQETVEPKSARITRREREVICLIEQGLTNKAIASRLNIEVQTVKNHVHNILEKLDLQRRIEVARFARTIGWIGAGTSTRPSTTHSI